MKPIAFLVIFAAATALSACNTVKGVGQDVGAAGRAVEGAAREAQN